VAHMRGQQAFTVIWPLVWRWLEGRPNMNATGLFDELRAQYPLPLCLSSRKQTFG
jgi:hypothetical protein